MNRRLTITILSAVLLFAKAASCLPAPAPAAVVTYHYNNGRTGANTNETILTPHNVNSRQFGKLFTVPLDGSVYGQPLYVPGVNITDGQEQGIHDVIYVATTNNSLYAIDAHHGEVLWSDTFGGAESHEYDCSGYVGVFSTPVIDLTTNTIYLVTAGHYGGQTLQKLYAIDIASGGWRVNPVVVTGTVSGHGYGNSDSSITFDPTHQIQRGALALDNGAIMFGEGVLCDVPYVALGHGWFFSYDKRTLAPEGTYVVSPDGYDSDIWAGGGGPATDAWHNIYIGSGNGDFNADSGGRDHGDSALKLLPNVLTLVDYFTPANQAYRERTDEDFGAGGMTLLPDGNIVTSGKMGIVYVLNSWNLGEYNASKDTSLQSLPVLGEYFHTPTYWNHTLWFSSSDTPIKAFPYYNGRMLVRPSSMSPEHYPYPGSMTIITADGRCNCNGILWALKNAPPGQQEVLIAYDARDLRRELYRSDQAGTRDLVGTAGSAFRSFTVVNGEAIVTSGQSQITVLGLLSTPVQKRK